MMEEYTTGTGQRLRVHSAERCKGESCVIHNPSAHAMRGFPTHWRADRALMERICPHGIGHPDPDDLAHYKSLRPEDKYYAVHGCDGCCAPKKEMG